MWQSIHHHSWLRMSCDAVKMPPGATAQPLCLLLGECWQVEKMKSDDLDLWYVLSVAWNSFYKAALRGPFKSWQETWLLLWAELVCTMVAAAACGTSHQNGRAAHSFPCKSSSGHSVFVCRKITGFHVISFFPLFFQCGNIHAHLTSFIQHFVTLCVGSLFIPARTDSLVITDHYLPFSSSILVINILPIHNNNVAWLLFILSHVRRTIPGITNCWDL